MEDVVAIEKNLRSMSPKFAYVVCSNKESKDINALSIDELQSSLLVHEQRMAPSFTYEQTLKSSTHIDLSTGRGSNRGHGGGR